MKKIFILFLLILSSLIFVKPFDASAIEDLYKKNDSHVMPSTGNVTALVIPINFKNEINSINRNILNAVFNDNTKKLSVNEYSLYQYYYESSNNKLKITADIKDTYTTKESAQFYANKYGYSGVEAIINEYFKDKTLDPKYDINEDGVIDALYLIYNHKVDAKSDFWWAYTANMTTYTNPEYVDNFSWIGYEFLTPKIIEGGTYYKASVVIHETGHLLGLDDYYDYDHLVGPKGGLGLYDMMDANLGDHNAFSKLILGWIDDNDIIKINHHNYDVLDNNKIYDFNTDKVMIISLDENNLFSEYFIVELLNPYSKLDSYLVPLSNDISIGYKLYHVKADKGINSKSDYKSFLLYNNSDTKYKLIDIIESDKTTDKKDDFVMNNKTLFKNEIVDSKSYLDFNYYGGLDVPIKLTFKLDTEISNIPLMSKPKIKTAQIKINYLDNSVLENAPKFKNAKSKYLVKRNGIIKKDKNLKAYDYLGHDITDKIKILGSYDESVPGSYKMCYQVSDGTYTSYYYFDVEVLNSLDNSFMKTIIFICVGAITLTAFLCFIKVKHDRKKLTN